MAPRTNCNSKLGRNLTEDKIEEEMVKVNNIEGGDGQDKDKVKAKVKEKEVEEKKLDVRRSLEVLAVSKPQVSLVNFKLPLSMKRRRVSSGALDDEETKKIKIQADGQELTVDCAIARPKCGHCRVTLADPTALKYHNLMTHPVTTPPYTPLLISPTKRSSPMKPPPIVTTNTSLRKVISLPNLEVKQQQQGRNDAEVKKRLESSVKEEKVSVQNIVKNEERKVNVCIKNVKQKMEKSTTDVKPKLEVPPVERKPKGCKQEASTNDMKSATNGDEKDVKSKVDLATKNVKQELEASKNGKSMTEVPSKFVKEKVEACSIEVEKVVKSVQEEVKLKLLESINLNKDKDNVNVNKNELNKVKEKVEQDSNKLIENNDVILWNGKSKTLVLDKNNCNSNIIDVKNNKIKVVKDDKNLEPNVKVLPGLTDVRQEEAEKRLQTKDKVDNSKPSSFLGVILRKILTRLSDLDSGGVFQQPVDLVSVPDYLEVINKPMDLSTMSKKVATGQYESVGDFELDFHLMVNNCLAYNRKSTKYYRAAKTMQRVGRSVFMKAKTGNVNVPEKSTSVTPKILTNGSKIKVKKNTSSSNRVKEIEKGDPNRTKKGRPKNARVKDPKISNYESEKCSEIVQDCSSSKLEDSVSVGSTASEAAPSDSGVSTTAPDSDTSASSEFALPNSVPRRKGPKKPLLKQPMQTELTGRRQSERRFGGEKPFGCNHCLLTFSNHLSKVAHERTHMEKPLECPFCEMRFMGDLGLQRHSKIHARQLLESGGNPGKG